MQTTPGPRSPRRPTLTTLLIAVLLPLSSSSCVNAGEDRAGESRNAGPADGRRDSPTRINGAVEVPAGQRVERASTVNGSIRIGARADVGSARTVNGSITLEEEARAGSLRTVNGGLTLAPGAQVGGDAQTVNGTVRLEQGSRVAGRLESVNGRIQIAGAQVGGGIRTVTADLDIGSGSKIAGGIRYSKPSPGSVQLGTQRIPRVVIRDGAEVNGPIRFERAVELRVSPGAKLSRVEGATAEPLMDDAAAEPRAPR